VALEGAYGTGEAGSSGDEGEGAGRTRGGDQQQQPPAGPEQQAEQQQGQQGGRRKGGVKPGAAAFSPEEVARRRGLWEQRIARPDMQALIGGREALPIASYREQIVAALDSHQVVLVAGETGCGKTTQVPQYILEDAWYRGKGCRVVCTQPRRISAVSGARAASTTCRHLLCGARLAAGSAARRSAPQPAAPRPPSLLAGDPLPAP
jgi:HrpA-like RNA helicase